MKNTVRLICLLLAFYSCKEEGRLDYIENKDAPPPIAVNSESIEIINRPGRSLIRFRMPDDKNLRYVKALCEQAPGEIFEQRASIYVDSVLLDGFAHAGDYTVRLISVGKNDKESEAVVTTISPTTPPYLDSFASLSLSETFGGVLGRFTNPSKAPVTAVLLIDDGTGHWTQLQTFSKEIDANAAFVYGGLDTIPQQFAVYLRDKWGHRSDTLTATLTPLAEEEIPMPGWVIRMDNGGYESLWWEQMAGQEWDNWAKAYINGRSNRWYGSNYNAPGTWDWNLIYKGSASLLPRDLGLTPNSCWTQISRIRINQPAPEPFGRTIKKFELYGAPVVNPSGDPLDEDGWVFLGAYEIFKPSGIGTSITDEDRAWANGIDVMLSPSDKAPNPWIPVRHICLRVTETYNGSSYTELFIEQVTLFGKISKRTTFDEEGPLGASSFWYY